MKTSRQVTMGVVLFMVGTFATSAHGSQQTASKAPSNTRQMRCVVKVTADAGVLPLSVDLIESLVRSDAVADEAARRTWPTGHGAPDAYFDIEPMGDPRPAGSPAPSGIAGPPSVDIRMMVFGLRVSLDSDVEPRAREFGHALIKNLRAELEKAFTAHSENLKKQLTEAEAQREALRTEFEDMLRRGTVASPQPIQLDPADEALHKQLQTIVDLSVITQQTPAAEAFEILRHAVEPPLNLIVIWRDLFDNTNIEPSSPVQMDGPACIRLGTALQNLLTALTDPLALTAGDHDYFLDYMIDGGAITVATRASLPPKKVETRVYELPPLLRMGNQTPELAALIRETIEPASWHDPYLGSGNGTIAASADGKLIVSQSRDVHIKIQDLLTKVAAESAVTLPGEASQETLDERLEPLLSYREQLEQELDRLQIRQGQIAREWNEERRKAAEAALCAALDSLYATTDQLKQMQVDMAKAKPNDPESVKLQRAIQKLEECTNHCRQVAPGFFTDLGWWIPESQGTEEKTLGERIAAKQSDLREVSRRIAETQRMMAGSKTFDLEFSRIEWTARRCEQADARVHDLKIRLANLQPCTVTVIGGTE